MYKSTKTIKNICIFSNYLSALAGAEKQAVYLAKVLSESYNVWLVIYYGNKYEGKDCELIKNYTGNVLLLEGTHLKKIWLFSKFLKEQSVELIFSYLLTTNFIAGIIGKLVGVKYSIGGIRSSKIQKNKIIIQRFLHNCINKYTIYNNFRGVIELKKYGFKPGKTVVIPNCFWGNLDTFARHEKEDLIILTVARFTMEKDFKTSIGAIVRLYKENKNFKYYIVGYGKLENQIKNWINNQRASEYIKLIKNPGNVFDYYKKADVYLQTSIFEGLSNSIMEAVSFSLPVVVTDVGDNNTMVIENYNGFLCRVKDMIQIKNKLAHLIKSYNDRIEMGCKGPEIIKKKFSKSVFKNRYVNFLNRLEEI